MRIPKITPELCVSTINAYITPAFEANAANGAFDRRDGSLIIATVPVDLINTNDFDKPDDKFRAANIVYEHSWGRHRVDEADFSLKAIQKVFGTWKLRKDYDRVLAEHPEFVEQHGLIKYPGAVIRDVAPLMTIEASPPLLMVAGYAGLWWWHDTMIAGQTLDALRAEITRQTHEST